MNVLIEIYLAKPLAVTLATTFKFAAASDSYDDSKLHFIENVSSWVETLFDLWNASSRAYFLNC